MARQLSSADVTTALGFVPNSTNTIAASIPVSTGAVLGNSGTAGIATAIALGANLSITSGTLNAAGATGAVTLTGDITGTGTGSVATALATITSAGSFGNVTVNGKGLVTSGRALASGDITTALGFAPVAASAAVLVNVAGLQAATSSTLIVAQVVVQGYYAAGDGGGGTYVLGTTTTANGGTIINDASGRSWYMLTAGRFLSPEMFGAYGDGSHNDNTAMTNFFAALQAPSRQQGMLSARNYNISQGFAITAPISLRGCGNQLSVLNNTNASLNVPVLHLSGAATNGSILEDFAVNSVAVTSPTAIGIQVDGGQGWILSGLRVSYTYGGISIPAGQTGCWIRNCFVNNTTQFGFNIEAGNMNIEGCYADFCGGNGYQFTSITGASAGLIVSGCVAFNCGLAGAGQGFAFVGTTTYAIMALQITGCTSSSTPYGAGYTFDTHGINITMDNLYCELAGFTDTGTYSTSQTGILVTANNAAVTMSALTVSTSGGDGIDVSCSDFTLTGAVLTANNQSGNAEGSGLGIGISAVSTNFAVSGVMTKPPSAPIGVPDTQKFGINSYTSGNTGIISGCVLHGVTSAFQNVGSTATFANNLIV